MLPRTPAVDAGAATALRLGQHAPRLECHAALALALGHEAALQWGGERGVRLTTPGASACAWAPIATVRAGKKQPPKDKSKEE